ncbi:MAG: YkgJ family cysteine cluster protein [Spirochaetes bacterium]|nr:YkgJ family cysteine cluster protein [Spirochaetota bacterium]
MYEIIDAVKGNEHVITEKFTSWLNQIRKTFLTGEGVKVPCGNCTACCTSSYYICIDPDEKETLAAIPGNFLFSVPGETGKKKVLGFDENGECFMFMNNKCSIYDRRPRACRNFDCRIFTAAGIPVDDNRVMISRQVRRWKFNFSEICDQRYYSAVQACAKFIAEFELNFPQGLNINNALQQAAAAIKAYHVFLDFFNAAGKLEFNCLKPKVIDMIVSACEQFDSGFPVSDNI